MISVVTRNHFRVMRGCLDALAGNRAMLLDDAMIWKDTGVA